MSKVETPITAGVIKKKSMKLISLLSTLYAIEIP